MNAPAPARRFPWIIGIGLLLLILLLSLAFLLAKAQALREHDALPVLAQVVDFSLTNQNGSAVSLADLRGHVWVADIIFTRCAGPCPRMTRQMKELQDSLPKESQAKLVTLTTDPENDTPAVLKTYGRHNNQDTNRWMFLTGTKQQIANLAINSLKLSAVEVKPEDRTSDADLWVHSTIFVVVDKHAQLRGVYETGGEGVDWAVEKQKILAVAKRLERDR